MGGDNVKHSLGKCQRAGTVPHLGKQQAGATRTYGGDDKFKRAAARTTAPGPPALVAAHIKRAAALVAAPKKRYNGDDIKARPPDECAKKDVSCGGSPQIKATTPRRDQPDVFYAR